MRYTWKDIPALLQTPVGQTQFISFLWRESWPILSRLAILYRHSFVRHTRTVAVVGSFGKTTTAGALAAALGCRNRPRLGPDSTAARAILHIRPGDRHAVIDVGINHPGQMAAFARLIQPNITVVTSIGSEHNRSLPTLEVTRGEKSEMVKVLPASGIAVLNGDDPNVLWMRSQTRARVMTFGMEKENDVRAGDIKIDWPNGTQFKLQVDGKIRDMHIRLIGRHMVYPILAAVAVSLVEGLTLDEIIPALEGLPPTPGRLEMIRLENGVILLRDDYKSGMETIDAALDALSEIPAERRFVVLGEVEEPPGSQGPIYRRLGERIAQMAWRAVFIGGDSTCSSYTAGAKQGGLPRERISKTGRDVLKAADLIQGDLKPGDVVLIKGRDIQRMERVAFLLMGRRVLCDINICNLKVRCARCPMLERGWKS